MVKYFTKIFLTIMILALLATVATPVLATSDFGVSKLKSSSLNLPSDSPGAFVARIIRWVLGIIGIILVAMIVYGGVTYATAAGSEERAGTAKKILTYAIIGVAIVAAAYIISSYVMSAFFSQPSSGGSGGAKSNSSNNTTSSGFSNGAKANGENSGGSRLPSSNNPTSSEPKARGGTCDGPRDTCADNTSCLQPQGSSLYYCLYPQGHGCELGTADNFNVVTNEKTSNSGCVLPYQCKPLSAAERERQGIVPTYTGICQR